MSVYMLLSMVTLSLCLRNSLWLNYCLRIYAPSSIYLCYWGPTSNERTVTWGTSWRGICLNKIGKNWQLIETSAWQERHPNWWPRCQEANGQKRLLTVPVLRSQMPPVVCCMVECVTVTLYTSTTNLHTKYQQNQFTQKILAKLIYTK